jgi:hypothetical protein
VVVYVVFSNGCKCFYRVFMPVLPLEIQFSRGELGFHEPCCCVCPKTGHGFPTPTIMVVFMFNVLRRQVVVSFVDIDGTFDHHYLNFHFL